MHQFGGPGRRGRVDGYGALLPSPATLCRRPSMRASANAWTKETDMSFGRHCPSAASIVKMSIAAMSALLVAAGCGGGSSTSYSLDASRSCLSGLGATTAQADLDYIAQDASAGAIGVDVSGAEATVMFHSTANDAKRTVAALRVFAEGLDLPADDILEQDGNVAISWDRTPTGEQQELVAGCLS
jgi:hypothetical protein